MLCLIRMNFLIVFITLPFFPAKMVTTLPEKKIVQDHTEPYQTIRDLMRPEGPIDGNILDLTGPHRTT